MPQTYSSRPKTARCLQLFFQLGLRLAESVDCLHSCRATIESLCSQNTESAMLDSPSLHLDKGPELQRILGAAGRIEGTTRPITFGFRPGLKTLNSIGKRSGIVGQTCG